ncbi:hypothetical protein [Thiohalomonas denitrificans]|uniref:Antitermination protein NusG n=1 Tax=Thiohalomonas denitrificans TaxID=415747 RepID=A0A1G5QJC9_9GAMM|nr:hypothetical protein [Thiohalomonas denitrificans]SCZ61696.1 hypothetical protein SAMN03097708_02183 [Thiohalomonas denitrificans]
MITKLLFTALIVAGVIFWTRHRGEARQRRSRRPESRAARSPWYWRMAPAGALLAVLGVSAFVFWLEWEAEHQVFTVRVIDTRSGEVRQYPVYRDAVSNRSFQTIDGRRVTLADVERMELVEGAPSAPETSLREP